MSCSTTLKAIIALAQILQLPFAAANFDRATGHLRDWRPKQDWIDSHKPINPGRHIQASECGYNTRLPHPKVQLFAHFIRNPIWDGNHGCPYGLCNAYDVFPGPDDLEPAFTESELFFWHDTGGIKGEGVKPITNPQTGTLGYETSISGTYHDGSIPVGIEQVKHDENYPGFDESKLKKWTQAQRDRFLIPGYKEPSHPICANPCQENQDPGSDNGVWVPYPASAYRPPPEWQPGPKDTCWKNGRRTGPLDNPKCAGYCKCVTKCAGDSKCISNKCRNRRGCNPQSCSATTNPPGPNPPGTNPPGTNPPGTSPPETHPPQNGQCKKYCRCAKKCESKNDSSCLSQCPNKDNQCSANSCETSQPNPGPNPPEKKCSQYCDCAQNCNGDKSCLSQCPNKANQCDANSCSKATPSPGPLPSPDLPDVKCSVYCQCSQACNGKESCLAKCPNKDNKCSANSCSKPSPAPGPSLPDEKCSTYCQCSQDCNGEESCLSKCPNEDNQCSANSCSKSEPAPGPNLPDEKCSSYCQCSENCNGDSSCLSTCSKNNAQCKQKSCPNSGNSNSQKPPKPHKKKCHKYCHCVDRCNDNLDCASRCDNHDGSCTKQDCPASQVNRC